MRKLAFILVTILTGLAAPASAETPLWGQITLLDLSAARQLLEENHPAAVPELGDRAFLASLAQFPRFEELARKVTTFGGYQSVLNRFAASFGDRHIARYPTFQNPNRWPGFLVSKTGANWIVRGGTSEVPEGSVLLSCDGQAPDQIAANNLAPLVADWSLRAQRLRAEPYLLVDQGDPFAKLPQKCAFAVKGEAEEIVQLSWKRIADATLREKIANASRGVSLTNGTHAFGKGQWIRLGTFQDEVRPVVENAMRADLINAPFIIIDVRGNTGGSSAYAEMLAAALYGPGAIRDARKKIASAEQDSPVWRASAGNLALLEQMVDRFTKELGTTDSTTRYFADEATAMKAALARGEPFSQSAQSTALTAQPKVLPRIKKPPPVLLLTDTACFSACLEAVQLFRELGAIQVGDDTDGGLNYFEVRAVPLPSGLSQFSTMQSYSRSRPLRLGPFVPQYRYDGDPVDEAQVRTWMGSLTEKFGRFD